jgi:hypothetical protein
VSNAESKLLFLEVTPVDSASMGNIASTPPSSSSSLLEPSRTGTYVKYPYQELHGNSTLIV